MRGRRFRWGKKQIRDYCHGGKAEDKRGPQDGCAVAWPFWLAIPHYYDLMFLIKNASMPGPDHWEDADYRLAWRIYNGLEALRDRDRKEVTDGS